MKERKTTSRSGVPLNQRDTGPYLEALETLWRQKNLPLDARNVIVGAAHRAGLRQGEKLLHDEEVKEIMDTETRDLRPEQWIRIYERTHKWLFVDKACRPQYVIIVLHTLLNFLNKEFGNLAVDFEKRLRAAASQN